MLVTDEKEGREGTLSRISRTRTENFWLGVDRSMRNETCKRYFANRTFLLALEFENIFSLLILNNCITIIWIKYTMLHFSSKELLYDFRFSSTSSGPFIIIIASIKFLLCSTRTILNDIRRNETKGGIIGDIFYVFTQTSFFRKKCYKNIHVERIIDRIRNWLPTERAISNSRGRIVIVTFSSGKTIFPQRGYIQTRFISDNTFT